MKKHLLLAIVSICITTNLAGCTMRRQFILPGLGTQNNQQTPSITLPDNNNSKNNGNQANNNNITNHSFDFTSLREQIANVQQVVNHAQRQSTYMENLNVYHEIKQQIKQVEFQIETMEHQVEEAYRVGTLDVKQYRQLDHELDNMEDTLDFLEDALEYRLGVDDEMK